MNHTSSTLITKSAFASRCGRTPAAISQWIDKGILKTSIEIDEKGQELVRVPEADAEVAAKLDPSQQHAQPRPLIAGDDSKTDQVEPSVSRRYLEAKATEKELDVEAAQRRMRVETGRWMETDAARRVWARDVAQIFMAHDAWMSDLARSIATEHGLDAKAVTVHVRKQYRQFRADQAQAVAQEAAALPDAPALAAE
jgi:hypothetical protein